MHRNLFANIGGFVKPYPYGHFEDEELYWRMKLCGFKQAVCGSSFVRHKGGTTMQELLKDQKIRPIIETNQQTYISDIRTFAKRIKR